MKNIKCSRCGFINFADAMQCERCYRDIHEKNILPTVKLQEQTSPHPMPQQPNMFLPMQPGPHSEQMYISQHASGPYAPPLPQNPLQNYQENSENILDETVAEPPVIKGWLLVFGIYLVLMLLRSGYGIFQFFVEKDNKGEMIYSHVNYALFFLKNSSFAGYQLVSLGVVFAISISLFFLFGNKSANFRSQAILCLTIILVERFIDLCFMFSYLADFATLEIIVQFPKGYADMVYVILFFDLVISGIWIPYFLLSNRVEETFINESVPLALRRIGLTS